MEDASWRPPTEAELKVLEARRERMDKISMIMGDYLLKGYKMLGDICGDCDTILLEDRQNNKYCIACSEVDTTENVKDNPVLCDVAAQRLVQELQAGDSSSGATEEVAIPATVQVPQHASTGSAGEIPTSATCVVNPQQEALSRDEPTRLLGEGSQRDVGSAFQAVQDKMTWAAQELHQCASVEISIQMCHLIKSCAEAMAALQDLRCTGSEPACCAMQGQQE